MYIKSSIEEMKNRKRELGWTNQKLANQAGIPVGLESNGRVKPETWKGTYPVAEYDKNKWKKLAYLFYGILAVVAVVLGVVNIATYDHLWCSGIAIPGIAYAGLTVRYSILKHANLGKMVVI